MQGKYYGRNAFRIDLTSQEDHNAISKIVKIKVCPLEAFITTQSLSIIIIWIIPFEVHLKKKLIKTTHLKAVKSLLKQHISRSLLHVKQIITLMEAQFLNPVMCLFYEGCSPIKSLSRTGLNAKHDSLEF